MYSYVEYLLVQLPENLLKLSVNFTMKYYICDGTWNITCQEKIF